MTLLPIDRVHEIQSLEHKLADNLALIAEILDAPVDENKEKWIQKYFENLDTLQTSMRGHIRHLRNIGALQDEPLKKGETDTKPIPVSNAHLAILQMRIDNKKDEQRMKQAQG